VRLADLGSGLFVPSAGNSFLVLSAGSGIGGTKFKFETLPAIGGGLFFDVEYDTSKVIVNVAGVTGDYNRNGVVDAADYVVWRDTLGGTGSGLAADGNGDLVVDNWDYGVWRAHFGQTVGSGTNSLLAPRSQLPARSAAIPEPAALWLLVIAGGLVHLRRRGSRYAVDASRCSCLLQCPIHDRNLRLPFLIGQRRRTQP
jgi:hypothetical protein